MLIRWQDHDYDLDLTDFTLKQCETIEAAAGMTIGAWLDVLGGDDGLTQDNPQFLMFLKVLYWLMLNQAGDTTPIKAVDFPVLKFGTVLMAAFAAEEAAAAPAEAPAPDPTRPAPVSAPSPVPSSPSMPLAAAESPDG
jgi:hypothetical protein